MNEELKESIIETIIQAGKVILEYFRKNSEYKQKADNSPITKADLASNKIINKFLCRTGIPVISEENKTINYTEREHWKRFWLVDPLDGTREFIAGNDEFTVNIALIENNYPIYGFVYLPAADVLYFGGKGEGAFKLDAASATVKNNRKAIKLPLGKNLDRTVLVASKSHINDATQELLERIKLQFKNVVLENFGSSLKLCMIAEGRAAIYPRLGPTMEWDIAAAHAIVEASGNCIVEFPALTPLRYNKENLLNPWFIAYRHDKEKAVKALPLLP